MNRSVTPPANGGEVRLRRLNGNAPAGVAPSLAPWTFGRRSLVWPVTASARGRSFLADLGTCRAGPAAPLGVPATARRQLPLPLRVSRFASAAAADPSATLQGGLVRKAAVGRARAECGFAEIEGAPSSPRSSSGQRVGFKVARKSSVIATRHEPPRPCTVAGCVSPKSAAPCSGAVAPHIEQIGLDRRFERKYAVN